MSASAMPPVRTPDDPDYAREVYTVKTAAAYLAMDVTRLYRELAARRIGCRRDSARRIRFSQADLDAWRAARRVEAVGPTALRPARPVASTTRVRSMLPPVARPVFG